MRQGGLAKIAAADSVGEDDFVATKYQQPNQS
jgi:hypothetical protein